MVSDPVPFAIAAQAPASVAEGWSQTCGCCFLGMTSAEGTTGPVPADEAFFPIMMPPTWSQGPTSPVASLSQIRSSWWSTVVAVACVDVVIDEGRVAAGVMVGFLELFKKFVAKVGEAVVGWVEDEVGCIASGFSVSSKEPAVKVGEALVG